MTLAALVLVTTWQGLAACERTVVALERLQHAQQYAAASRDTQDERARQRAIRAFRHGVRSRDLAQFCVRSEVGEDE